jgi:hypothetical protein
MNYRDPTTRRSQRRAERTLSLVEVLEVWGAAVALFSSGCPHDGGRRPRRAPLGVAAVGGQGSDI